MTASVHVPLSYQPATTALIILILILQAVPVCLQRYAKGLDPQDDAGIDVAGQDSSSKATPLTAML